MIQTEDCQCIRGEDDFQSYSLKTGDGYLSLIYDDRGGEGKFSMECFSRAGHSLVKAEYFPGVEKFVIIPRGERIRLLVNFTYAEEAAEKRLLPLFLSAGLGAIVGKIRKG